MSALVCAGCGWVSTAGDLETFSCPKRKNQDDIDHVLRVQMTTDSIRDSWPKAALSADENPFVRYRRLSHTYRQARELGMSDQDYVAIVEELDRGVRSVTGKKLTVTKTQWCPALDVTIKDETQNPAGSHKIRHLMGTAIHLKAMEHLQPSDCQTPLAIASCGNAALSAAVVAKAMDRHLQVFVPDWADAEILRELSELGAQIVVCTRSDSDLPGDQSYLRFVDAVKNGAIPFSCQGSDNAITIVGGHTLGWELIEQLQTLGRPALRHLFLQVGGGALARSVIETFLWAHAAGLLDTLPRFYAVQPEGVHPLVRAWQRLQNGGSLKDARTHRHKYMWPWESPPHSIASGIIDDETYDWYGIVEGLQASSGSAISVSEDELLSAQEQGETLGGFRVSATGTAGLAGLLALRKRDEFDPSEHALVLFTGVKR